MVRPTPLGVIPTLAPVQLVLGLTGVGIERPHRKRRTRRSPWLPRPVDRAA